MQLVICDTLFSKNGYQFSGGHVLHVTIVKEFIFFFLHRDVSSIYAFAIQSKVSTKPFATF